MANAFYKGLCDGVMLFNTRPIPPVLTRLFIYLPLLFLMVGATGFILASLQPYIYCPPNHDEAVHLLPLWPLREAVQERQIGHFLWHSYHQEQLSAYPFIHSWLLLPLVMVGSFTTHWARVSNVFLAAGAVGLAACLAPTFAPKGSPHRWFMSWYAVLGLLPLLPLWAFASRVYLEPAGLLLTFAILGVYASAPPPPYLVRRLWLVSFLMALAFLTKYNFGLFPLVACGLSELQGLWWHKQRPVRRWVALFAPVLLCMVVWFLLPGVWANFREYSQSQQTNMPLFSWESLTFYGRSLWAHYTAGPFAFGLVAIGLGVVCQNLADHRYRFLFWYFLVNVLVLTLWIPQKEIRFAYVLWPAATWLMGLGGLWAWQKWGKPAWQRWFWVAQVIVLLVIGGEGLSRFTHYPEGQEITFACTPYQTTSGYEMLIQHSLDEGFPVYLLNHWHLFNHYALLWEWVVQNQPPAGYWPYQLTQAGYAPEPTPAGLDQLYQTLTVQPNQRVVSIDGSPAGSFTGWQVIEPLWANQQIEWLATTHDVQVTDWSDQYEWLALSGEGSVEAKAEGGQQTITLTLHIYKLLPPR